MVTGKVKTAMGLTKSPKKQPHHSSETVKPPTEKPTVFSRSFGVYFPRTTAQVQPRPPDVTELLRLVEELRDRESRLKTELLEFKLLKESVSIIPVLENEIFNKRTELETASKRIESLEGELLEVKMKLESETALKKAMEVEIQELKKTVSFNKLSFMRNLKKEVKCFDFNATKCDNEVVERPSHSRCSSEDLTESTMTSHVNRATGPRVPKPPPPKKSTSLTQVVVQEAAKQGVPPPPPPPLPPKGTRGTVVKVRRVPEVVEFYHSLMRRECGKKDPNVGMGEGLPATANARDMIGEIENRSTHLLSIKNDVETQGDFIRFLIKEVEDAAFADIEDLVPFVKWLDDELSYLVDERAVLKHFDWPEQKADALREAAFEYCDHKKLESEALSFCDNPHQPGGSALKKMQALFEKLEHGAYNLSRMKESATKRYKGFGIPTDWMLETGILSQIKLASVKLAMKYMKRVSTELETVCGSGEEEDLIIQGIRFAFRVHQFAGGFDVDTMRAFEELRDKAKLCNVQCVNQQQPKPVCRSAES